MEGRKSGSRKRTREKAEAAEIRWCFGRNEHKKGEKMIKSVTDYMCCDFSV
jgi:hypothetical protein